MQLNMAITPIANPSIMADYLPTTHRSTSRFIMTSHQRSPSRPRALNCRHSNTAHTPLQQASFLEPAPPPSSMACHSLCCSPSRTTCSTDTWPLSIRQQAVLEWYLPVGARSGPLAKGRRTTTTMAAGPSDGIYQDFQSKATQTHRKPPISCSHITPSTHRQAIPTSTPNRQARQWDSIRNITTTIDYRLTPPWLRQASRTT